MQYSTNMTPLSLVLVRNPCSNHIRQCIWSTNGRNSNYISTCTTNATDTSTANNATKQYRADENGAKTFQRRPKKKRSRPLQLLHTRKYLPINRPPMTAFTAEWPASKCYRKTMLPKLRLFNIITVLPRKVAIHENQIRNAVAVNQSILTQLLKSVQKLETS